MHGPATVKNLCPSGLTLTQKTEASNVMTFAKWMTRTRLASGWHSINHVGDLEEIADSSSELGVDLKGPEVRGSGLAREEQMQ